jgi:hypothetical protein
MLRRPFIALLAASVIGIPLLAAQSANAQWNNYGHRGYYGGRVGNIDNTQTRLYNRLTTGLSSGRLTQNEYSRLLNQYNQIAAQEARLRASGLNPRERMILQNRLSSFQNRLQRDLNDRQGVGGRRWSNRGGGGWWY